jgi:hypothetical protein
LPNNLQQLVVDFELLQVVMLLVVLRRLMLLSRDRGGGGRHDGELRFG